MRIWSILLIKSDLKWCIHLSRSLYLYFSKFIDHFDKHAGQERPVILLIDSVSSHINMDIFTKAKEKGIELYRLVPNATHVMQPFDMGVFALLKKE